MLLLQFLQELRADRQQIAAGAKRMLADGNDVFLFFKHEDTPEGALHAEEILNSSRAALGSG